MEFFEQVAAVGKGPHLYLALAGALMTPDICSAMESPDGRATGERYREWFDTHLARQHLHPMDGTPILSGADCFRLRCSFLHQGTTQHEHSGYSRVVFVEPGPGTFHMNVLNDALNIDIGTFCQEMAGGALAWLSAAEGSENFKRNYPLSATIRSSCRDTRTGCCRMSKAIRSSRSRISRPNRRSVKFL